MDESIGRTFVSTAGRGWGPGNFDAELALDGKAFRPDGKTSAVLVPPAFGLAGVNLRTWTGGGSAPYSSALVPSLELHGKGNFFDSRLRNGTQFPITARVSTMSATNRPLITSKLASLRFAQLAIPALEPPAGSWRRGIRYLSCPAALEAARK